MKVGLDGSCAKHHERFRHLGFAAAEPHCGEHVLAPGAIRGFHQRFGAMPLPSAPMEAHDRV